MTAKAEPLDSIAPTVVVGPSGVGKGTLLARIRSMYPETFSVAVSHTTRAPRNGEINGVHYHFVSREQFERDIEEGCFLEYADVHGRLYGTSRQAVLDVARDSKICLLEIDVQGAQKIRDRPDLTANYLFVTAPNGIETLRSRLEERNTESSEQIERRLATARFEFNFLNENAGWFDSVIVNDDLEKATSRLANQFELWYPWIGSRRVEIIGSGMSSPSTSMMMESPMSSDENVASGGHTFTTPQPM